MDSSSLSKNSSEADVTAIHTKALSLSLLFDADQLFQQGPSMESFLKYKEGLTEYIKYIKALDLDRDADEVAKGKVQFEKYMQRAEELKDYLDTNRTPQPMPTYFEYDIPSRATGYPYERVFGKFFDDKVTVVTITEPYLKSGVQYENLGTFCRVALTMCPNLTSIVLTTSPCQYVDELPSHRARLETIREGVELFDGRGVKLSWHEETDLHDRRVRLDNGWIIKCGRGLHYFREMSRCDFNYADFSKRSCFPTNVTAHKV